jgi:hypothetical protein
MGDAVKERGTGLLGAAAGVALLIAAGGWMIFVDSLAPPNSHYAVVFGALIAGTALRIKAEAEERVARAANPTPAANGRLFDVKLASILTRFDRQESSKAQRHAAVGRWLELAVAGITVAVALVTLRHWRENLVGVLLGAGAFAVFRAGMIALDQAVSVARAALLRLRQPFDSKAIVR